MIAAHPSSPHGSPHSRRALLAGAVGGIGAWVLAAAGRPREARAADGGSVLLGNINEATHTTWVKAGAGFAENYAFRADGSLSTGAIYAISTTVGMSISANTYAIDAFSASGNALKAESTDGTPIYANTASGGSAVYASNGTQGTYAFAAGTSKGVAGHGPTGVYGYDTANSSSSKGVWGETTGGHGIHGTATTGYAGYFAGKVYTTKWYEFKEISNPAAPTTNRARLFVRDNGAGKTQLCVRFEFGAVQVIATQP